MTLRRTAAVLAVLAFTALPASALVSPGVAHASIARVVVDEDVDITYFEYLAEPGEVNQVEVSSAGTGPVRIRDTGATITAGLGCTSVNANEVSCDLSAVALFSQSIYAGDLDDTVTIASGDIDYVSGGLGSDSLTACSACSAWMEGGDGDDTLEGPRDLRGDAGNDTLRGTGGRSQLLIGDAGDDTLIGGDGHDHITPGLGNDSVDGGSGPDTVSFWPARVPITADLATGIATGQGTDTLTAVSHIEGGRRADRLSGDDNANELIGYEGNDIIIGRGGNDPYLLGQSGADLISGGDGADTLFGDSGNDTLLGGLGNDRLEGGPWADLIKGGDGADSLHGEGGKDTLLGGAGPDLMRGQLGSDTLLARDGGRDDAYGGDGHDRGQVDPRLDVVDSIEAFF